MRTLPAEFLHRQAIVESCFRAVPRWRLPLDTYSALFDASFFVRLRPAEFSRFALAVVEVRQMHAQRQQERP